MSIRITEPLIGNYIKLFIAKAYAIAPLKPESHITNCIFPPILDSGLLDLFTRKDTISIFKKRVKFSMSTVVNTIAMPIYS